MSTLVGRSVRPVSAILLALGLGAITPGVRAQTIVNAFPPKPVAAADLVSGTWYNWFSTGAGVPAVVSLAGQGGTLEANQPLPIGAALLLTQAANSDRTNVGVYDVLGGTVGDVFPTLNLAYEFYKKSNPGQNLNAAAALKLEVYNPTCDDTPGGDCFATLIWEPYQNGFGNFPAQDVWHQASITPTSGTFWSSGGFGRPNGAGGCPCLTLSDYLLLSTADFAQARVVSVQIGVGSFNPGQVAYFDDLRISHSFGAGLNLAYDFELLLPVEIDLRPGSTSNQINTNAKQLVPIAVLGSSTFDPVTELDSDSVLVRGASPIGTKFDTDDVNGDGFADYTLYFRARDLEKPTGDECDDPNAEIELTGATLGGMPIKGSDNVTWQGPDCP